MPYTTISSGLTLKVPTSGTRNWGSSFQAEFAQKISEHDHTGSGKGLQIATAAIANSAVTTAKINNLAVDGTKLAAGAVSAADKIADAIITAAKLDSDLNGRLAQTGSVVGWLSATAPSGWLLMKGDTIGNASSGASGLASATASVLFAYLWNNLADAQAPVSTGRGANAAADFAANKTITVPDMRQRFPLGLAASGTGATLGGTGGTIDHTHSNSHTHDIATHTHTMGNHTHTGPSHTHTVADHNHSVPTHYHNVKSAGGTVNITSSGAHTHEINIRSGSAVGSTGNTPTRSDGSGSQFLSNVAVTSTDSNHIHANSDFTGTVGNTSGVNGDAAMTSGGATPATDASGTGATGAPSNNTTDGSGTLTTGSPSSSNTGTANPAFMAMNFIIKI